MNFLSVIIVVASVLLSSSAFASGSIVNWYEVAYRSAVFDPSLKDNGFNAHFFERLLPICGSVFTLLVTVAIGLYYRRSVKVAGTDFAPGGSFNLRTAVEMAMDVVYGIAKDNIGEYWRTFMPLLSGIFLFILITNLGGLIPGFIPATENLNTNLAIGVMVFIVYNVAGFREHNIHYLKQFAGPMIAIAPLMITIELISHLFRPVSLSLRLMGNIFADHLMLGIFTSTAPHILIPTALMFFGLLVSVVQSFVFTLLTGIYISLAVSHDH